MPASKLYKNYIISKCYGKRFRIAVGNELNLQKIADWIAVFITLWLVKNKKALPIFDVFSNSRYAAKKSKSHNFQEFTFVNFHNILQKVTNPI
jgi:hypothetical protein